MLLFCSLVEFASIIFFNSKSSRRCAATNIIPAPTVTAISWYRKRDVDIDIYVDISRDDERPVSEWAILPTNSVRVWNQIKSNQIKSNMKVIDLSVSSSYPVW